LGDYNNLQGEHLMTTFCAPAIGAALVIAAASFSYAQTPQPPGTDRPGGTAEQQSANPDMDRPPVTGTPGGSVGGSTTTTPPGTDRPAATSEEKSASPKMDKKR
jgi:hypothetical protein